MLSRLFPLQACEFPRMYVRDKDRDISAIYDFNKELIDDLEEGNFSRISKDNYYAIKAPSKTKIKEFLKNIRTKYNLQGVSIEEKQLVDALRSCRK